jgi:hypothetical protein
MALLCAIFPSAPLLAQTATQSVLYLPLLQTSSSAHLGIGLSNPALSDATVTLTARAYDGSLIQGPQITNPATIVIHASSQQAFNAEDVFGSGILGHAGWVQLQSNVAALKALFTVFDFALTFIDGANLQSTPASRIIFPKISTSAIIAFVNTGTSSIPVEISMFDNSGNLVTQTGITLNAYSGFSGPVTTLLPGAGSDGYLVVDSAGSPGNTLVGTETYRNRSDIAVLNAVPDTALMRTAFIPHLVAFAGYVSRLAVVNPTGQQQTVRLTAQNLQAGTQALAPVTVDQTIPANGRIEQDIATLFRLTSNAITVGSVQWQTLGNTPGVVGYLDFGSTDGVLLSAVPAQNTGYSDLFFSQVAEGIGFYTGLAFLNPNVQSTVVAIDVFALDGSRTGSTVLTLAPGQRQSMLLDQLVPGAGGQLGGYVRATASRPVIALELFGSSAGLTFLANVSAQGLQVSTLSSGSTVNAAAGAEVFSADGSVSLLIPPGALSSNTNISIGSASIASVPNPSPTDSAVAVIQANPSTSFNIPVALTFPLSAQLDPGALVQLLLLSGASYQASGFTAVVDSSGRTATARVTHFSTYVLPLPLSRILSVTTLSPSSGGTGSSVTISGQGFSTVAGQNTVTFAAADNGSVSATVTNATATSLTVTVPVGSISGDVVVRVGSQTSLGLHFDVTASNPRPAIFSITPNLILVGSASVTVTIRGVNFRSDSSVTVDGQSIPVTFIDQTQLQVTFSANQLSLAVHQIAVSNTQGGGTSNIVELTAGYPVPTIAALSPVTAQVGTSPVVTISGTGFFSNSVVYFDDFAWQGSYVGGNTMLVTLNSPSPASHMFSVFNPGPGGGLSNRATFTFTPAVNSTPPTLMLISPNTGVQGQAPTVTITGANFVTGGTAVNVSGVGVSVSNVNVQSSTSLTASLTIDGEATPGQYLITLTTAGGTSQPLNFTVNLAPPTLTSIVPASGTVGTTVSVVLNGTHLNDPSPTVSVSGTGVTAVIQNIQGTALTANFTMASNATLGVHNVSVITSVGTTSSVPFTVNAAASPPTLTSISPTTGFSGTAITATLTGTNFVVGGTTVNVSGSGVTASNFAVSSSTSMTANFTIDSAAGLGSHNVAVTTAGGNSGAVSFVVVPTLTGPTLTSISPSTGIAGTALTVTLTGTNFVAGATTVNVGGGVTASNFAVSSSTSMTAQFTVDAAAGLGPHNVTVTTPQGTSGAVVFNVVPAAPGVTGLNPQGAQQGQIVTVTITGSGFVTGGTSVSVGGSGVAVSNVNVQSSTSMTVTLTIDQEATPGSHPLTVTTAGGTSSPINFTVNAAVPTLSGISPASGTRGTSVTVTLTGTHLNDPFASVSAGTGVTVAITQRQGTTMTATFTIAANASTGAHSVSVSGSAGQSNAVSFTVN